MNTRELERRFWDSWYKKNSIDQVMRMLQYVHQRRYLPFVNNWGLGFRAPGESVIEIGCGPCGLAPWLGRGECMGIDPLIEYHQSMGVDYFALGYSSVFNGTAQEYIETTGGYAGYELAICCNTIDHDQEPEKLLEVIAILADSIFLAYDLRHTVTMMHPGKTDDLKMPEGWNVKAREVLPAICDKNEINGTAIVYLEKSK